MQSAPAAFTATISALEEPTTRHNTMAWNPINALKSSSALGGVAGID